MTRRLYEKRRGNVIALFAILLPVVLLLCGVAINIAYMQLTHTEMQIAVDAAARAGGRAFSEFQDVDMAKQMAFDTAPLNMVAGAPLRIDQSDSGDDIQFGQSQRSNNGYGRYEFQVKNTNAVRNKTELATAIRISAKRDANNPEGPVDLFFAGLPLFNGTRAFTKFEPAATAVSSQVDRDIALTLDRSGSMAESVIDFDGQMQDLKDNYSTTEWAYVYKWGRWRWVQQTVWSNAQAEADYNALSAQANTYWDQYYDWYYGWGDAPDASRWKALDFAVNEFLDVLEGTDQEELVSVASFSSSATLDLQLESNYNNIRTWIENTSPGGATAIGQGLQEALPSLFSAFGRPYAAKTIVVLTDGINNQLPEPLGVTQGLVGTYNVTIHTVTFSHEADTSTMAAVAHAGGGKHYHAEDTAELAEIFREIANNLPTIITE
ncbi:MAG: VWA domain-containing protein [Planctomycetales bacterium]|nr:VWA domain-containing protein [Planctomycetales bacterium]